ncbi:acyl-CoA thioesterase, partial [Streptomyces inhibens]|uniref:acyl-CoA thioesterase n=1 Tax=Streptomyces inhibens TaxID=2293571 RepID=UPI00369EF426
LSACAGGGVGAGLVIEYVRPLVHRPAPVTIELWVTKISAASMTVGYEVKDEDNLYLRASTVIVPYNFSEERPRRLTVEEKTVLKEYLADASHQDGAVAV